MHDEERTENQNIYTRCIVITLASSNQYICFVFCRERFNCCLLTNFKQRAYFIIMISRSVNYARSTHSICFQDFRNINRLGPGVLLTTLIQSFVQAPHLPCITRKQDYPVNRKHSLQNHQKILNKYISASEILGIKLTAANGLIEVCNIYITEQS